jgi:hypothetical protein
MRRCEYCQKVIPMGDSVVRFSLNDTDRMVLDCPNRKKLFFHRCCFGPWYTEIYQVKMIELALDVFV